MRIEDFPWKKGLRAAVKPSNTLSVEELLKHPLFDYQVAKCPVYGRFEDSKGQIVRNVIKNLYMLYRKDTLDQFATCTERYRVRQNSELLMFANNILNANVEGINPTILFGSISNNGARLYIVINIAFKKNQEFDISHNIILYAGHDTKLGINFLYLPFIIPKTYGTGIRLSSISPITKKEFLISFKHTATMMETFQKVYGYLNNVAKYTYMLDAILVAFSEHKVTEDQIFHIVAKTFLPEKEYERIKSENSRTYRVTEEVTKALINIMTNIYFGVKGRNNPSLLTLYMVTSEVLKSISSDDVLDAIRDKNSDYLSKMFILLYKIIANEKEKALVSA